MYFYCEKCKKKYPINSHSYQCECGGMFKLHRDPGEEYVDEISLGEVVTPLVEFKSGKLDFLLPRLKTMDDACLQITTDIRGLGEDLTLPHLRLIDGTTGQRLMDTSVAAEALGNRPKLRADIDGLWLNDEWARRLTSLLPTDATETLRLTNALCPAEMQGWIAHSTADGTTQADLHLQSASGTATVAGQMTKGGEIDLQATAERAALGTLLPAKWQEPWGELSMRARVRGMMPKKDSIPDLHCEGTIETLEYKGHAYRDVPFEASCHDGDYRATASLTDDYGDAEIQIDTRQTAGGSRSLACYAAVQHFNPHALGFTKAFDGESFTLNLDAHLQGTSADDVAGRIRVEKRSLFTSFSISSRPSATRHRSSITSGCR